MAVDDLIRILQGSIGPCVLISGIGLLVLSMTNRLGRATDRTRELCKELPAASKKEKENLNQQIALLFERCQLLQYAIFLSAISIFCVSLIILMLFSSYIFSLTIIPFIKLSFVLSLICLIASLICFLFDIHMTLRSLKVELEKYED